MLIITNCSKISGEGQGKSGNPGVSPDFLKVFKTQVGFSNTPFPLMQVIIINPPHFASDGESSL